MLTLKVAYLLALTLLKSKRFLWSCRISFLSFLRCKSKKVSGQWCKSILKYFKVFYSILLWPWLWNNAFGACALCSRFCFPSAQVTRKCTGFMRTVHTVSKIGLHADGVCGHLPSWWRKFVMRTVCRVYFGLKALAKARSSLHTFIKFYSLEKDSTPGSQVLQGWSSLSLHSQLSVQKHSLVGRHCSVAWWCWH